MTASAFADVLSRTLTATLAEPASGYEKLLWTQAWQQLRRAYEAGWPPGGPPSVYANGVVHGTPSEGGGLSFTWPTGTPGFAKLVSRPGLYAIATVDINTHYFSTVRFLNRNVPSQ